MHAVIRADASMQIGSGHVMRCLTLAEALRNSGVEVSFICREHEGHLCNLVAVRGYRVVRLPRAASVSQGRLEHSHWLGVAQDTDAKETCAAIQQLGSCDWLIVDHYGLDAEWESAMRGVAKRIMVIDDLADRTHDCDVLLDQNMNRGMDTRYDGLLPAHCTRMIGPKYALLRPEFTEARKRLRSRDGNVGRIFVFFGGTDPTSETRKTLEAVRLLGRPDISLDVVVGAANPDRDIIADLCASLPNARLHCQIDNIAEVMAQADLAIGAGGGTMWERFCVGLPSIVISVADNQCPASETAARAGKILYLGESGKVGTQLIRSALELACASPHLMQQLGEAAMALVDGRGAGRVVHRLVINDILLRRAGDSDCESIYRWRNAGETRRYSGDAEAIPFDTHVNWFRKAMQDPAKAILIGELDGRPVGVLRYDRTGDRATVSVYLVPGNQGRGLGPRLLEQGTRWVEKNWPDVKAIDAWIKPENQASLSAFKDAGYQGRYKIYCRILKG